PLLDGALGSRRACPTRAPQRCAPPPPRARHASPLPVVTATVLLVLHLAACARSAPGPSSSDAPATDRGSRPRQTLRMVFRAEPDNVAGTRLSTAGPGNR